VPRREASQLFLVALADGAEPPPIAALIELGQDQAVLRRPRVQHRSCPRGATAAAVFTDDSLQVDRDTSQQSVAGITNTSTGSTNPNLTSVIVTERPGMSRLEAATCDGERGRD
jgi:hypothetical protein